MNNDTFHVKNGKVINSEDTKLRNEVEKQEITFYRNENITKHVYIQILRFKCDVEGIY